VSKVRVGTFIGIEDEIVNVEIDGVAALNPGAPTRVLLGVTYFPVAPPGYPTRGGQYNPGETAAFPATEAAAMVAAGVGSLA
jgi:hypothetical protein